MARSTGARCVTDILDHLINFIGCYSHQAIVMRAEMNLIVTFELETRAARQFMPDDAVHCAKRCSSPYIRRTVDGHNRSSNRNRRMHQSAVITDKHIASLYQRSHLLYCRLPCGDENSRSQAMRNLFDHLCFRRRAKQDYLRISHLDKQALDYCAIALNGPLLPSHRRRSAGLYSDD